MQLTEKTQQKIADAVARCDRQVKVFKAAGECFTVRQLYKTAGVPDSMYYSDYFADHRQRYCIAIYLSASNKKQAWMRNEKFLNLLLAMGIEKPDPETDRSQELTAKAQEINQAIEALDHRIKALRNQIKDLEQQRSRMTWVSAEVRAKLRHKGDRLAALYAKRSRLHDRALEIQEARVADDYDRLRDRLSARVG
jgi:chromosome segregation ATPase